MATEIRVRSLVCLVAPEPSQFHSLEEMFQMKFKTACLAASLAAAGLATTGMAHAQSKVELYGIIDVNVEVYNNAPDGTTGGSKTVSGMNSGGMSGSRWDLRGSEDLGNGLKAVFQFEGGFNVA